MRPKADARDGVSLEEGDQSGKRGWRRIGSVCVQQVFEALYVERIVAQPR
ncbi:MAG: hypothetical protein M3O84_01165 [Actinomycetota bacterium]|nr:hypothetical protein [Actinomycetota bacterium]